MDLQDASARVPGAVKPAMSESLALDDYDTDEKARAVAVDARGILEALRKVYDAGGLARELAGP